MKKIALISTGGTIEKTYNPLSGALKNEVSVLDVMLGQLTLSGIQLDRMQLMNKDSLEMTEKDHRLIALSAERLLETHDGIVIVHGTDRLAHTGEYCYTFLEDVSGPIVLTGAMRPYELRSTDALQNVTEALMAVQLLSPGIYVAMHNQVLAFPGVEKDPKNLCFRKIEST